MALTTNYIKVALNKTDKIYLYRVDFTPAADIYGSDKGKALRKFAEDPSVGLDNKDYVYDRENLLYCMPSGFAKLGDVSNPLTFIIAFVLSYCFYLAGEVCGEFEDWWADQAERR